MVEVAKDSVELRSIMSKTRLTAKGGIQNFPKRGHHFKPFMPMMGHPRMAAPQPMGMQQYPYAYQYPPYQSMSATAGTLPPFPSRGKKAPNQQPFNPRLLKHGFPKGGLRK